MTANTDANTMTGKICLFWFRRDLRLDDNAALYHALKSGLPVLPVFIFDTDILDKLEDKKDARVTFIYDSVKALHDALGPLGSTLIVKHGEPLEIWKALLNEYDVAAVYANHDYEPKAIKRDAGVKKLLEEHSIDFHTFKDQVIFEKSEVVKPDGNPYTVFTPYSRKWKEHLTSFYTKPYPTKKYFKNFYQTKKDDLPTLQDIGFQRSDIKIPSPVINDTLISNYDQTRDYPGLAGTSRLGIHLRFGTISTRELVNHALKDNQIFLNELIWREFYMMILYHFPHVVNGAFKKDYDQIAWENNETLFRKWCEGMTGFPIVDAGMRELNATGFMHNRARMITASFLTKHLLVDWRWGEQYFAEKLLDYELASNNGGWQWSAGTGCDATPYFRIFNPNAQTQKFDKTGTYIRKWVPEYGTPNYPKPVIDLDFARKRALEVYKKGLQRG